MSKPTKKAPTFTGKNAPGKRLERGYIRVLRAKKGKR